MYYKEKMLVTLKDKSLNTFDYRILMTEADLIQYHIFHREFTIRFTKDIECPNLPFYIIDKGVDEDKLIHIAAEAHYMHCAMLVSDGIMYEKNQVLNFVFCKQPGGRFLLEYHFGKEPLRNMYHHKTTVIIGNLYDSKTNWGSFSGEQKYMIGYTDLEYILNFMQKTDIFNKYVECTLYDCPVGIQQERIIVWGY